MTSINVFFFKKMILTKNIFKIYNNKYKSSFKLLKLGNITEKNIITSFFFLKIRTTCVFIWIKIFLAQNRKKQLRNCENIRFKFIVYKKNLVE